MKFNEVLQLFAVTNNWPLRNMSSYRNRYIFLLQSIYLASILLSILIDLSSTMMTSIDQWDAEVQQHFTAIRKAAQDAQKEEIAQQISQMYQRSEDYSYGIFTRTIKFISESNDREDKKIGLMVLSALGPKIQGTARSLFVNKFHSPVFKLIENNQEEYLISYIERAYEIILQIGGNRNDSAVQSNLLSCFAILQSKNSKDVSKIGAYAVLRILVCTSPYITFKKLMQKQKNSNLDNLSLAIASAKVRNIKVRLSYLNFLVEYVKYIAEKKDHTFQKATFERFYQNYMHISAKETNEELNHLYLQTINIFMLYLTSIIPIDSMRSILEYTLEKIQINKNSVIEKSLIQLLPYLSQKKLSEEVISCFLKFLRTTEGEIKIMSQKAINMILETTPEKKQYFLPIYKDIIQEILKNLYNKTQSYIQIIELSSIQIKTIQILIQKFQPNYFALISGEHLDNLVSCAMVIRLDQEIIKLITDIAKNNIHSLGRTIEIKFIITISKILTGSARKVLREANQQFKGFLQFLELKESVQFLQNQTNKVRAIQALSQYRFREQFRDVVGGFVKDRVLKYYLEWGNSKMKIASVEAAFFLYAKKGKQIATNQLLQVIDKLVRVGLTDSDENVREKVFMSIAKNFKRHEEFLQFFTNISLLSYLFQAVQDRNQSIRLWALKIVCILYNKNPSVMITPFLKKITYNCFYHLSYNFKYYNHKRTLIQSIIIIIEHAPSIIENHIDSLLNLLLNYLADRNNYEGLELLFFELIKTLATVLPNSIIPYSESFSQHLVVAMKDKLNTKNRVIALKTFISIIRQCGYVVIPYFQITSLKQTLTFLIRSQIQEQSRNDIMRIIGALGAVDNLRFNMIMSGCGTSKSPESLVKSLNRLNQSSNFLAARANLIREKQESVIEKQLKLYYDQLILMQNNQKLILLSRDNAKLPLPSTNIEAINDKIELQIDSSMNFHMIILKSLFQILDDKSLSEKQSLTLDVLTQLLELMGNQIQKQLPTIMEILLKLVKSNEQILNLIYILAQNCDITQFVGQIVTFVITQCKNIQLAVKVLTLVTAKYNQILRHLMELIIDKLHFIVENYFTQSQLMVQVSFIYQNVKNHLEPYLTIIIPQIMDKFFNKNSETTNAFVDFIMSLCRCCSSTLQFMPLMTSYFARLLNLCQNRHSECKPCLRVKLCNCIVLFITIFKGQFISYLPMLHKSILRNQQIPSMYFKAVRYLQNCSFGNISSVFTEQQLQKLNPEQKSTFGHKSESAKYLKRVEGIEQLIHEFDPMGKKIVDEDWVEWLKKTSIFLLKKSPNSLLRTCSVLADEYNELGLQLYNISFFHFWEILVDEQKKVLIDNIKKILLYNPKPFLLVRKTFLALAEFMNRKKCSFELSSSLLADCAGESSSFAKQLYYREQQFEANPEKIIESLIDTYMKLGEPENAYGLFTIATSLNIHCKIEWYQKIGRFEEAYKSYTAIKDNRYAIQKIKCLSYIDDDQFISHFQQLASDNMSCFADNISILAVEAYAHLQNWDRCETTLAKVNTNSIGKQFWSSVLSVKKGHYTQAMDYIGNSRKLLYEQIPDLMNFSSTSQAFQKFICMQQLFELEQIVNLKQKQLKNGQMMTNMDEAQKIKVQRGQKQSCQKLRSIWNDRLIGCSKNSNTFKQLSIVRSLFFTKALYFDFYYELCEIFIKENKINKCQQLIKEIKSQLANTSEQKLKLLQLLQIKIEFTSNHIKQEIEVANIQTFLDQHTYLHPRKIGELYYLSAMTLYDNSTQQNQPKIVSLLQKSAQLCNSQKQWYILSIINLEFAQYMRKTEQQQKYIQNALISLTNSLKIATNENEYYLQGYLKLLSVLCNHSKMKQIYDIFQDNFRNIPVEGWINVVPQMIAQLYQLPEQSNFLKILKMLLKNLGIQHPEAVLFSLNFALKSKIEERTKPARQIIDFIKTKHSQLAEQVQKISNELGRTAIKLKEYWFDGIESAWSSYNQNKNADQIVVVLKQICETVLNRKESNSEIAFHQQFGQEIRDGYSWLVRFEENRQPICIAQVFQTFYGVYKKVKDSFENIKKVYLKNVAPFLVTSKKYKSTIPGLYVPNKPSVKITGFCNQLIILQSKQRPRKLTIYGDDGKQYNFLLKGREDLRLDERVMQFFSLVNKLLAVQRHNLKRNLQITRYSIIPLTVNTGLIGWVQNCDTLNELIKEYRTVNKIRVYVQKQLYEKMCPDYAYLPIMNKLQIFKNGLQSTQGKDLQKILWLKSPNSEVWVEKRNNYTCSLATMSIVGYILGLGDRHPSNIMLKRDSGKIVHIDFGDCFEVAVLRDKFPERVPFRLTRMLQKAMGIPSIHGLYRFTCQMVMKILRQNKQSLFGVLQTFAQDPIISWRLTNEKKEEAEKLKKELKKDINDEIIGSIMDGLESEINELKALGKNGQADIDEEHPRRNQQQGEIENKQQINEKAIKALFRIKQKLRGTDFDETKQLTVQQQVTRLIQQATSPVNICQSWPGWCPFW